MPPAPAQSRDAQFPCSAVGHTHPRTTPLALAGAPISAFWPISAFFPPGLDQTWSLKTPQQRSLALTLKYEIKTVWGLLVGCQEADTKAAVCEAFPHRFVQRFEAQRSRKVQEGLWGEGKAGLGRWAALLSPSSAPGGGGTQQSSPSGAPLAEQNMF